MSAYQLSDKGADSADLQSATQSVHLWFDDREDGSVVVINADNGLVIDTLEPGTNGFVRGALRSLARERRASGMGEEVPFSIHRMASGQVVLHDAATDRVIDLRAFGPTNRDAFARFLNLSTTDQIADDASSGSDDAETGVAAMALTLKETRK